MVNLRRRRPKCRGSATLCEDRVSISPLQRGASACVAIEWRAGGAERILAISVFCGRGSGARGENRGAVRGDQRSRKPISRELVRNRRRLQGADDGPFESRRQSAQEPILQTPSSCAPARPTRASPCAALFMRLTGVIYSFPAVLADLFFCVPCAFTLSLDRVRSFPRCGQSLWRRPCRAARPMRCGFSDIRCSRSDRFSKGRKPEIKLVAASGVSATAMRRRSLGRTGSGLGHCGMRSTAKADAPSLCCGRIAPMQGAACLPGGARVGCIIPDGPAPIQIGPQKCAGHFGEFCIRARGAAHADGPLIGFEEVVFLGPHPDRGRKTDPRHIRCWSCRRSSRVALISPSPSPTASV